MRTINRMFKLSESRGKEASGLALRSNGSIYVLKEPITSSKLVKTQPYKNLFNTIVTTQDYDGAKTNAPVVVLGHSRLQTNGLSEVNTNNQPVVKDGAVGIHNGIIVNDVKLWQLFPILKKSFDVDTEVFLGLLQMFRAQGKSMEQAVKLVFENIEGSASIAVQFEDTDTIALATNTGSLYLAVSKCEKILAFASEKYILEQVISKGYLKELFAGISVSQVKAGTGCIVDPKSLTRHTFNLLDLTDFGTASSETIKKKFDIVELYNPQEQLPQPKFYPLRDDIRQSMINNWEELYSNNTHLKRCIKCLLPETMPYINFDDKGVCSYCKDYETRGSYLKGEKALEDFISKYRSANGETDVLIGFSGGRDSAYGLDYIKNTLKLNPTTFTYDWGMVNDLARRNQARVVGKLGIEHVVISADIKTKRAYIKKNLKAWLKRPNLGMVPILMAGDKQFYYYFHKVRKQTGLKLFIFCGGYEGEEGTGLFKYGFCNVTTQGKQNALKRMTGISKKNKFKMMYYYFKQFVMNPSYINKSMLDTLFAYYSSYVLTDDYLYLFHYIDWDEKTIIDTITKKFDWERETDTIATWRTDDGTAAFYNYIYLTLAGFTEFDIFRSHQIREGKLTREEALKIVIEENKPRFKSIEWYGQAIDFNMNEAIEKINKAPKLYQLEDKKHN